ncbi:2-C-methyl-D-erythritol 2,4-cyclodiphosphate synthase [Psychromonas ingrahamii 37]|uniref:2-C-methyl-D-erythritol 2,4-cyclodiphosphate synthase n=1 Tax=Psychromonas ingrahamii (strain DSM 17664 / CCUG 51855 / 37) TaxID=357804 RepID=A1SSR1_PSYIN|nr:2-C-methyl-D-erythritol 2,4-cyclodiphosphate synthase [Psychromonas ingrahamii]ABM02526.1 2-C-methyl-D-erythritol 2,4-cyclodiphosphate synthase [Psychromonas ingrahamii 37]
MIRIGHGFDVHKFGGQGPITIAGVKIPYHQGLIAHSDGDVALHALCDALLGALALGDIGRHFPDNDPQYAGIDSRKLLENVFLQVKERGYQIGNIDLTIVAEQPKMAAFIPDMCVEISQLVDTEIQNVNVKATTTERLGAIGRSEGIATHAVVLLMKKKI